MVPSEVKTLPLAPGAIVCKALVPLPNKTLLTVKVVAPVPPLATATVPVTLVAEVAVVAVAALPVVF